MPYQTIEHGGRKLSRWIPDNPIEIREELGVVYVYRARGKLLAVAYKGNSAKSSFHYSYKDMEAVDRAVCAFFDGLKEHKARVTKYRHEANAGHTLKVGDIITNSWGYDQTNVDWYVIVKTSKNYVWLQEISAHVEETGFMSGPSVPHIDTSNPDPSTWGFTKTGEVTQHKASGNHVTMKFGSGSKWDGQKQYCSWYA